MSVDIQQTRTGVAGDGLATETFVDWLVSDELVGQGGHCLSWWNPAHPGYPYPEITGLLLQLLSQERVAPTRCRALAAALVADHLDPPGGIGANAGRQGVRRFGVGFTFDTAMALRGLVAYATSTLGQDSAGVVADVAGDFARALVRAALERDPNVGANSRRALTSSTRWSASFGAHQAKICGALADAPRLVGQLTGLDDALEVLVRAALDCQSDAGRFRVHSASRLTYVHSHCYAVEGLLMYAAGTGRPSATMAPAGAGADWLAVAQEPNGALRAWHDGDRAFGPGRSDATAQAVRIWALVDPDRYAGPIAEACTYLSGRREPGRGLRYEDDSSDISSWATIFAAQALAWAERPSLARAALLV